jgi:glyoxylase I family protein
MSFCDKIRYPPSQGKRMKKIQYAVQRIIRIPSGRGCGLQSVISALPTAGLQLPLSPHCRKHICFFNEFALPARGKDVCYIPVFYIFAFYNNKTHVMKNVFLGIDHPAIAVKDIEKAVRWYCDALGYKIHAYTVKPVYILKAPDGSLLEIMIDDGSPRPQRSACTPGWSHVALRVSDFDRAVAALDKYGVQWEGPEFAAVGDGRIRNFFDPEDNMLQIVQR